ncbi:hypothetical protein NECID01_1694 [Nematocida sp. AWRm77]|nr:hypothetical protein NECID01_1694 [Nematocida sp. AWRm77]
MAPRTPRRTASKKTPYRARTVKEPKEDTPPLQEGANLLDLVKYYKEKDKIRDEYIEALKNENNYLRSSQSGNTPSLAGSSAEYESLLGLTITKENGVFQCVHSIEKKEKTCFIEFSLQYIETDQSYTYRLENTNIEDLPTFLTKEICFQEEQVKLFFFNVYEVIIKKE